jgi:hypothetical protein
MKEQKSRVAWKSRHTGNTGHGEYLPDETAKAALALAKRDFGEDLEHWLEPEPNSTPQ